MLVVATVFVASMSEILVGAVEHASHALGMNEVFVGVVVVAIVGNAAEHSTAVLVALKNQMDLAVGSRSARRFRSRCSWRRCWSSPATCGPSRWTSASRRWKCWR